MTITLPEIDSEVDAAIEQLIADLEFARDYIDKHGLAKSQFRSVLTNETCSDGAIMLGIGRGAMQSPRRFRALHALAATLHADPEISAQKAVYRFNDHPLTEKADVVALFQDTIDRLCS